MIKPMPAPSAGGAAAMEESKKIELDEPVMGKDAEMAKLEAGIAKLDVDDQERAVIKSMA